MRLWRTSERSCVFKDSKLEMIRYRRIYLQTCKQLQTVANRFRIYILSIIVLQLQFRYHHATCLNPPLHPGGGVEEAVPSAALSLPACCLLDAAGAAGFPGDQGLTGPPLTSQDLNVALHGKLMGRTSRTIGF